MNLSGVWVAAPTFFAEDGSLDLAAFENHLEFVLEAGVDGLVPCGTTGEGSTLSQKERKLLIEAAVKISSQFKKEVLAGCGGNHTESVWDSIKEAAESGASGALVVTPYYNKPTQAGLISHYLNLAERSPIPLVLYNVPSRTGVNLLPETVKTLWDHPNIIGLKEATGNHGQWLALASLGIPQNKYLLAGDDDAYATLSALGAKGIISASANVYPDGFVRMKRLLADQKWQEAFQIQLKLFPLIKSLFLETNPAPIKCALNKMTNTPPFLRLPLVPVNPETDTSIKKELLALGLMK